MSEEEEFSVPLKECRICF